MYFFIPIASFTPTTYGDIYIITVTHHNAFRDVNRMPYRTSLPGATKSALTLCNGREPTVCAQLEKTSYCYSCASLNMTNYYMNLSIIKLLLSYCPFCHFPLIIQLTNIKCAMINYHGYSSERSYTPPSPPKC